MFDKNRPLSGQAYEAWFKKFNLNHIELLAAIRDGNERNTKLEVLKCAVKASGDSWHREIGRMKAFLDGTDK